MLSYGISFAQDTFNNLPNEDLGEATDEFQEAFFKALTEKANGNHQRAINFLEVCQQIDENQSVIYFEKGKNYKALKAYDLAEEFFQEAVKREPENEWYLDELYDVYLKKNDPERAIVILKQLISYHNDYKEDLVELYLDTSKYSNALSVIDDLDESTSFSPDREKTRFKIYDLSNDYKAKEAYLKKRLKQYPSQESYYLKLILFYSKQNNIKQALEVAEAMLSAIPDSDNVHLSLYKFYIQQANIDAAVKSLLVVCKSTSISPKLKIKTLDDFKTFAKLHPEYEALLLGVLDDLEKSDQYKATNTQKAEAFLKSNNPESALNYFEKALLETPNSFYINKQTALLALQLGDYQKALVHSFNGMNLFPVQPLFYLINGTAYNLVKNPEKALESLEMGIDYVVNDKQLKLDFFIQLGECYKLKGNMERYNEFINKAEALRSKQ